MTGSRCRPRRHDGPSGRIGLRTKWTIVTAGGQVWQPYLRGNLWRDWGSWRPTLSIRGRTVPLASQVTRLEFRGGLTDGSAPTSLSSPRRLRPAHSRRKGSPRNKAASEASAPSQIHVVSCALGRCPASGIRAGRNRAALTTIRDGCSCAALCHSRSNHSSGRRAARPQRVEVGEQRGSARWPRGPQLGEDLKPVNRTPPGKAAARRPEAAFRSRNREDTPRTKPYWPCPGGQRRSRGPPKPSAIITQVVKVREWRNRGSTYW